MKDDGWYSFPPPKPGNRAARAVHFLSALHNQYRQRRVVAEHRLARLVQLGIRQARYFGRAKTKFQVYMAATVANITRLAQTFGRSNDFEPEIPAFSNVADANIRVNLRSNPLWVIASLTSARPSVAPASERGFRLNF